MSEPQRLTRWQYAEVRALCRQYQDLKSQAALLLGPRGQSYDPQPHGGGVPGVPVAATAERRERILRTVALIDSVARLVDSGRWARVLILNTCYGVPYDALPTESMPTTHRWSFFRARRIFFRLLWECRHGRDLPEPDAVESWNDFS